MPVIYQFSYDSPVRYLPLAYMLPYDVISRYPTLSKLPRSMGALNASPEWGKIIVSQQFLNEIMDAVASLAFPHFGFGGWKELALAAGRSITPAIPRYGACPTPCPCGPRESRSCEAGACRRSFLYPLTMRFPSTTRKMCAWS